MNKRSTFRLSIADPHTKKSSFQSFIPPPLNGSNYEEPYQENLTPKLLPKETIIAIAEKVLLFTPVSDYKTGQSGSLFVTNFKLSFVTSEGEDNKELNYQNNHFLGHNDICLSNIDVLYRLGEKKKRLIPLHQVSEKVKGLFIVCKNFRSFSISFKFTTKDQGKSVTNALLHHAYPLRHQLLFTYDYKEPYANCVKDVISFRQATDWSKELQRLKTDGWRISTLNESFQISPYLPQWLVVSSKVLDSQLTVAARHFRCGKIPIWCWGTPSGAALVCMADIIPTIIDRVQENIMLENVRKAHPKLTKPSIIDLTKDLPSPKELDHSFNKLRELCTPDSLSQFWVQDREFYTLLESSKWLNYVCSCLSKSVNAARELEKDITVVLQERDGRDTCCVVSSLIQLLLDPFYRTLTGFESLIQKEWVVMSHPFSTRLGLVYNPDDNQQSPFLLLFLDCVWQLLQQFPAHFQFTETFLTTLWDSAHVSIFDTFLFDCDKDRLFPPESNNSVILRSLWDWSQQFSSKDIALFYNPLYNPDYKSSLTPHIDVSITNLQLWHQCYFRFLPQLEIVGGGATQVDFISRLALNKAVETIDDLACEKVGSFYPFTQWRQFIGSPPPAALLLSTLSLNTTCDDSQSNIDPGD